jgi:hypothetical protein
MGTATRLARGLLGGADEAVIRAGSFNQLGFNALGLP